MGCRVNTYRTRFLQCIIWGCFIASYSALSQAIEKNNPNKIDYDRLCSIYEVTVYKNIELRDREVELASSIESNFPEFFKSSYVHIMKADPVKRYGFIKQLAVLNFKKEWSCNAMKLYYENEF